MEHFAARHALWSAEQEDAAIRLEALLARGEIGVLRFAFADAHGLLHGKTLVAEEALRVLRQGVGVASSLLLKDLGGRSVFPVFSAGGGLGQRAMQGAADMLMLPDPLSFRCLPWAPHSGWVLCDLHLADGAPMPLATRHVMRRALDRLAARGIDFVAGLEVECHILRLDDPRSPDDPPRTTALNAGTQYLSELRYDEIDPLMEVLRATLQALHLPLRSLEVEFGPSQIELTFGPTAGLLAADQMVLLRAAVKQVCRRHGYHASFMCRPQFAGAVSSGWHLHQSLRRADGGNLFAAREAGAPLSPEGRGYLAGLLAHATAAAAFSTPTINGYKRYRPYANAPDRANWARDNRGVMVRVLGTAGDPATRLENRVGEPAANPYLYMAAQIACGLDGMDHAADPGLPAETPYETAAPALPRSLMEAIAALRADACLGAAFGDGFIDYFARLKEAEIARFLAEVTDWEQREYFSLL